MIPTSLLSVALLGSVRHVQAQEQADFRNYMQQHGLVACDFETTELNGPIRTKRSPSPFPFLDRVVGQDILHPIVLVIVHPSFDGDDVVRRISDQRTIRSVSLSGCRRTSDDALQFLEKLPDLTSLEIDNTRISDHSIEHLCDITSLRYLDISYSKITQAGLKRLANGMPNCEIKHAHLK